MKKPTIPVGDEIELIPVLPGWSPKTKENLALRYRQSIDTPNATTPRRPDEPKTPEEIAAVRAEYKEKLMAEYKAKQRKRTRY